VTRPGHLAGLRASTPLRIAAERLLHARVADVRGAGARAARRLDARVVHDLRVACRRLRAAVKLFGKKKLRRLDGRIEHLQDALGELRDLQLQANWLSGHGADVRRIGRRLAKAEAHVRSAIALWTRRSEPLLLRDLTRVRGRGSLGGPRMRKRLDKRVGQLEKTLAKNDPLDPVAAHRIRVAAKKLRYDAELLRDAFQVSGAIEMLSELQSALGDLHDADVRLTSVGKQPRLASAARAERRRGTARAARSIRRARKLCSELRRKRL
jgi:CHAD domain-containing protein